MIQEQLALIEQLENHPEMPLQHKRGMLNVLHSQIGYMDQPTYQRYKAISEALEPIRRQIVAAVMR